MGMEVKALPFTRQHGKIADENGWKSFCDVADALQQVHHCRYIHNDLKSNNVVLETKEGSRPKPVNIDFGKSVFAVRRSEEA